jgi:hypothetical protein
VVVSNDCFGARVMAVYDDERLDALQVQCKHVDDSVIMYMDFAPRLLFTSKTVASITTECPDDAGLTLGTPSVVGTDTTVPYPDDEGRVVSGTLYANKAVQVQVSAGTAQTDDEYPVRLWFHATLSSGEVISQAGRIRVIDN